MLEGLSYEDDGVENVLASGNALIGKRSCDALKMNAGTEKLVRDGDAFKSS